MLDNQIFQKTYDLVADILPSTWDKIVFYIEYGQASYSMEFYVRIEEQYIKCFDLPQVDTKMLIKKFMEIDKYFRESRKNIEPEKLWSNMTMIIQSNGKIHAEYDYTDLSENAYAYKESWKNKYLS